MLTWEAAYGKAFQIQTSTTTRPGPTSTRRPPEPAAPRTSPVRHRPLRADVRHRARHDLRLLALRVPGLRDARRLGSGCNTGTNSAQGKTAVASSTENAGTPASAAVDGNTGTRWSSAFSDPQWIYVDLGSSQSVCQVTLNWEAAYATAFQVQTSPDAVDVDLDLPHHHRNRRRPDPQRLGHRPLRPGVRHGARDRVRLLAVGARHRPRQRHDDPPPPPPGCTGQSDTPNFGPNVHVFDPSQSAATIQSQLDADFNAQKDTNTAQFSNNRVAELFKPGTYAVNDNVGFYTSVMGLGLNPDDVVINGNVTVDAFNSSDAGNATQNFWREADNLSINPSGGSDRWAVAQAAPFRRIDVHGGSNW